MNINNVRLKRKKFGTWVHRINEEIAKITFKNLGLDAVIQ